MQIIRCSVQVSALLLAVLVVPREAQEFRPQFKITLDTPQTPGHTMSLGASVALEGDILIVGASGEEERGIQEGAVHVYRRRAGLWEHNVRLVSPNPGARLFGSRLAVSNDTLLVSSGDVSGGSWVYAFRNTTSGWIQETRWGAAFGGLAIEGDLALIGDPGQSAGGQFRGGLVHVCLRTGSTWSTSTLLSSAPQYDGGFGRSVALQGGYAAIGETARDATGRITGIVHVYDVAGGTLLETGTLVSGRTDDGFGEDRVVLDGDTLAVGAPYAEVAGHLRAGAVHVFVRAGSTWVPQATLIASDPDSGDWLGRDLGLHGDTLLAASEYDDNANGITAGSGRVFERQAGLWSETALLVAFEPREHLQLGRCAALSADTAVLTSPRGDVGGHPSGSVYVYARVAPPSLSIQTVTPEPIETLYPGTDRTVSIQGSGLDLTTSLYLDGTRVDASRYALVASDEIRIDMPQLPNVGFFSLGLHDGTAMDFYPIELVAPATPRIEIGTGDPLQPVVHHGDPFPVTVRLAGTVGSVQYLCASPSNLPSSSHWVNLALGNQFTQLSFRRVVIPAAGWIERQCVGRNFPDPGTGSLTVYAQMFILARPVPFRVSNLESILVLP